MNLLRTVEKIHIAFMQSFGCINIPRNKAAVFVFILSIIAIQATTPKLISLVASDFVCFIYLKFIHVWLVYSRSESLSQVNFIEINFFTDSAGHNINILIRVSSFRFVIHFSVHKTAVLYASIQIIRTCKVRA